MKNVKTIDLLQEGMILPPHPDLCQTCATKHSIEHAHNAESMYYQMIFKKKYGRWPTWKDAIAHCSPEIKNYWIKNLREKGVQI